MAISADQQFKGRNTDTGEPQNSPCSPSRSLLPYTHTHNTPIYGSPGIRMYLPRFILPDPPRVPFILPALRPSK